MDTDSKDLKYSYIPTHKWPKNNSIKLSTLVLCRYVQTTDERPCSHTVL